MEIHFRTRRLQRAFSERNRAVREWGPVTGQRYIDVVRRLRRTERVEDLYKLVPLRFHPLTGDRRGQHALRLTGQMRIIVTVEDEQTLIIEEVVDYHG
ncbi:MAG: type II toxin-antitoxin system RelE/ParE family toxin [Chloroflexi bacterium]|nr:type II toxin-antitoxin system RelE/ParE family toxin [Chloroflexota bacterium]